MFEYELQKPSLSTQIKLDMDEKNIHINKLCAIIMGHRILLIIQTFFIVLYILCKTFDWPLASTISVFSWIFPLGFYIVLTFASLFRRQYWLTLIYFLFCLLILCIPNKIWFVYHNIIIQFIILCSFLIVFFKTTEFKLNNSFKIFASLIIAINTFLFFAGDAFVQEKVYSNSLSKTFTSQNLNWEHFNKVDSINGGYHAIIETYIAYKINTVFNYTSATAVAWQDLTKNQYVAQSPDLLEHELYHFKITEIVTRKLNKALDNYHFGIPTKTEEIIWHYLDTLHNMQNTYDNETNHNKNSIKQKQWKAWVDNEIKK